MQFEICTFVGSKRGWRRFNLPVRWADAQAEDVADLSVDWAIDFASMVSLLTTSDRFDCTAYQPDNLLRWTHSLGNLN